MVTFNDICKQFENLDSTTYTALLLDRSARILPALAAITENEEDGVMIFANFILGAIAADGKLSEEEYLVTEPLLKAFFGESLNYETCRDQVATMRKETRVLKKSVDQMVDLLGLVSEELKSDIVLVCMLICAVDGKISHKEKTWIKQLIA